MALIDKLVNDGSVLANFLLAWKTWYSLGLQNNLTYTGKDAEDFTKKYLGMNSTQKKIYLNEMNTALQALQSINYNNPVCIMPIDIENDLSMSNNSFNRLIDSVDWDSDSDY